MSYSLLSYPSGGTWPQLWSLVSVWRFGVLRDFFLSPLLQLPHVRIHAASGQQSLVPGARRRRKVRESQLPV